ncbi:unnamed protein product [Meloidogyne enterolobii]|uniref:Uncharacterized protein n=1 Tax=Meloidogyne enterolobii TaxID=390850 RepID=A0ACB1AHE0_MELEN
MPRGYLRMNLDCILNFSFYTTPMSKNFKCSVSASQTILFFIHFSQFSIINFYLIFV